MSITRLPALLASIEVPLALAAIAALVVAASVARAQSRATRVHERIRRSHRAVMLPCALAAACLVVMELHDLPWRVRMARVSANAQTSAALMLKADDPPFEPVWDELTRQLRTGGVPSAELISVLCAQPEERWRRAAPSDLVGALFWTVEALDEEDPLVGALLRAFPVEAHEREPKADSHGHGAEIYLQVFGLNDMGPTVGDYGWKLEIRPMEVFWTERTGDGTAAESSRAVLNPVQIFWSFSRGGRIGPADLFRQSACAIAVPLPPESRLRLGLIVSQYAPEVLLQPQGSPRPLRQWTLFIDRPIRPAP